MRVTGNFTRGTETEYTTTYVCKPVRNYDRTFVRDTKTYEFDRSPIISSVSSLQLIQLSFIIITFANPSVWKVQYPTMLSYLPHTILGLHATTVWANLGIV